MVVNTFKNSRGNKINSELKNHVFGIFVHMLISQGAMQSPGNGLKMFSRQLAALKRSIDMALFVFSDQSLINVLAG